MNIYNYFIRSRCVWVAWERELESRWCLEVWELAAMRRKAKSDWVKGVNWFHGLNKTSFSFRTNTQQSSGNLWPLLQRDKQQTILVLSLSGEAAQRRVSKRHEGRNMMNSERSHSKAPTLSTHHFWGYYADLHSSPADLTFKHYFTQNLMWFLSLEGGQVLTTAQTVSWPHNVI